MKKFYGRTLTTAEEARKNACVGGLTAKDREAKACLRNGGLDEFNMLIESGFHVEKLDNCSITYKRGEQRYTALFLA